MTKQSLIPSFEAKELHSTDLVAADVVTSLNDEIQAIKTLANPATCKTEYLPFLAYAFKVDFWDESLDEDDKRNLIKSSILLHQKKGTIWAIEKVFEALNMKAIVKEWFDYSGEPYHFKIDLSLEDKEITTLRVQELTKYIGIYKNVRSVLDELILSYLNKYDLSISSGSIGEVKNDAQMWEGYKQKSSISAYITPGVICEAVATTKMDGYKIVLVGIQSIQNVGVVGEAVATAYQK